MEERRDVDKKMQLEELKANPRKVRFMRLCQMAEAFALRPERKGSHRIYFRDGIQELLNEED